MGRNCKKQVAEVVEDPIAKMLREMHADIKEIKLDQKSNNQKIDGLSAKVESIEAKANETDLKNSQAIEDLRGEIASVEGRVTSKLLTEMEPSLVVIKDQIQESVDESLRRLVREELASQKPPPNDPESSETDEDSKKGEPRKPKKKKSKKKIKIKNKKN